MHILPDPVRIHCENVGCLCVEVDVEQTGWQHKSAIE